MSNLPTPTSSAFQIPSPSVSSSRRTSLETTTRSSAVSSPALAPTNLSSAVPPASASQPAHSRRNRAALRDYYGLKAQPPQLDKSKAAEDGQSAHEAQVAQSELDAEGFDAQAYVRGVLEREGLEGVLRTEGNLVGEIKSLDGDRKALVYDNYSKLITATDTIRRMRANMDPLAPTTSTLAPAVAHIAATAEGLAAVMKERVGAQAPQIRTMNASERDAGRKEIQTVRWITTAPQRYESLIAKGEKDSAEKDWQEVRPILDKWSGKGVKGVEEVKRSCLEILGAS